MVMFSWDKELETGIDLIDRQHMQILIAVNKLLLSREQDKEHEQLKDCLGFLEQYIQYHFQAEENFQIECHFEDFLEHQAQHQRLSQTLRAFLVKLEDSHYEPAALADFYDFVMDWVRTHILQEDLHFAQAFRLYKDSFRLRR